MKPTKQKLKKSTTPAFDLTPKASALAVNLAILETRPTLVATIVNPFGEIAHKDFSPAPKHATIASLAPKTNQPFICSVDGNYISRAEWSSLVRPGEVIVFQFVPQGGKGGGSNPLRMILQIALVVGVAWLVGPVLGLTGMMANLASAGLMILGSLLINAIVPLPKSNEQDSTGASPTYNVALQGNSARLDQPKPVGYGLRQSYPDFAMQPYSYFINTEQYYCAVLFVGMGRYEFKKVMIDDTPISNFTDVNMQIVGPGIGSIAGQALIDTSMITSPEVSGQEIKDTEVWIGPFTLCKPGLRATKVYVDVVAPRGVGYAKDDGSLESRSITFAVQCQELDDFGNTVGDWISLRNLSNADYSATGATASAVQISCEYVPPDIKRYQIRVRRVTPYVDNTRELAELTWVGLRATLSKPGIVETPDPQGTYLFIKIRASKQLNGMSQRKIAVVWERKIPNLVDGQLVWVHDSPHHRNPAMVILDILTNPFYSLGLPLSRIDLVSLQALAASCYARQDHFDFVFDTRTTMWEALALVARVARAVPIVRGGNFTFVRDGAKSLPVAAYQPRNMQKDSFSIDNGMPLENAPDAVRVTYSDGRFWSNETVIAQYSEGELHVYVEGLRPAGVPAPAKHAQLTFPGIIGLKQAMREAIFIIADSRFRRAIYNWVTDDEALLAAYGELVALSHDLPTGLPQSAEVFTYDTSTRTLVSTQKMLWTDGVQHYVSVGTRDGGNSDSIPCARGATDDVIVLGSAPGFGISEYDDARFEPTRFFFDAAPLERKLLKLKGIRPSGENSYAMMGVIENDRVHTADNPYLPAPGEVQDVFDYGHYQNAVMPATGVRL